MYPDRAHGVKTKAAFSTIVRPRDSLPEGATAALFAAMRHTSAGPGARIRALAPPPMTSSSPFQAGSPSPVQERAAARTAKAEAFSAVAENCTIATRASPPPPPRAPPPACAKHRECCARRGRAGQVVRREPNKPRTTMPREPPAHR